MDLDPADISMATAHKRSATAAFHLWTRLISTRDVNILLERLISPLWSSCGGLHCGGNSRL